MANHPEDRADAAFSTCGMCKRTWSGPDELLPDPELRLLGLQAYTKSPDANLLVFEHRCGSTVSVLARRLRHLVPEDDHASGGEVLFDTEACKGYCRTLEDLRACDRPCANARDRRIIQLLLEKRGERRR
jgi:hypothetical protein